MKMSNKIIWFGLGTISMAGGDLKGNISGSGTVIYDGEIRDQEVRISGSGSVKRRKSTS